MPLAAVVANPARVRDMTGLRRRCAEAARAAGWPPPLLLATSPSDGGLGAAAQAVAAGAGLVFAVGGDGTVRCCAQALAGTPIPLSIVPAGSANLTARSLGIPGGLADALAVGFGGRDKRIDLADADGTTYVAMAGIGLDAAVVGATPDLLKRRAGWPAYAAAAAAVLPRRLTEFVVRLDGGEPLVRRARCVVVGNSGLLPGGFPLLPDARPDDGVLDVGILAPGGPVGWISVGYRVIRSSHRDDRWLERYRARRVEVRAATPQPRQADGEPQGAGCDLTVTLLPGALLIRVPAGGSAGNRE
jgi:diacylglycerol kinase family enzyme